MGNNNFLGIIEVLNDMGENVVLINGDYYISNEFERAEGNVKYHRVRGKYANDLLISYPSINSLDNSGIVQLKGKIERLPIMTREYNHTLPEIVYCAGREGVKY